MNTTTHHKVTRHLVSQGLNWGTGRDAMAPSRRAQGLGLGATSCHDGICPAYSMGCSSLEAHRVDQTNYRVWGAADGKPWSPGMWLHMTEPKPYGIAPTTGRGAQSWEMPCDSLYRFKRLDRPERELPGQLMKDSGDAYSPTAGQARDIHAWGNWQARQAAKYGYTWSFPRPNIKPRGMVETLGRSDVSASGDLELYPFRLPAQYSRMRHATEATAQPFGGLEALGKLPMAAADSVQRATPYSDAWGIMQPQATTLGKAPSGWSKRELGPMDSAADAYASGGVEQLFDELGTSLAPGRTFY